MTEPSEKDLIEHLNDFMDCVHPFHLGGHCPECQAIRRLIEKMGEWQGRLRKFDTHPDWVDIFARIAMEIRDFGEKGK
jgi:hypothetical protein